MLKKYKFGFDLGGVLLFSAIMLPNILWMFFPAPNDVLRAQSITPLVDLFSNILRIATIFLLCFFVRREKQKNTPLVIAVCFCVLLYNLGWILYYSSYAGAFVISLLTLPPCAAFLLYAIYCKNLFAVISSSCFAVCHLIYAFINFIIK